jgi:phage terminase large subunit GpA-like protein
VAAQGSDEAKRSFKNSVLGETWVESGEAPDWQRLYEPREESWRRGTVPAGVKNSPRLGAGPPGATLVSDIS